MRIIRIVLWSAIAIVLILALCSCQPNLPKLYEKVSPAVVWIGAEIGPDDSEYYYDYSLYERNIKWQGTGFIISSDGLIVTAGHIVEDTETFQLMFSDGRKGRANFAYKEGSETADVGFIQITWIERTGLRFWEWLNPKVIVDLIVNNKLPPEPIKNLPCVSLESEIEIAEEVIIVGYPWGLQETSTITQGIISALNRNIPFFGEKFMLHTDTASWPGNSGSAVFNMDGDVVGILVGGVYECDNYSLCTPAKIVILALDKYEAEKAMKEAK